MFQETPRFLASHTTEFNRPPRAMVDVDSTNSANIRLYKNFEAQGSWAKTFGLWGKKFCKVDGARVTKRWSVPTVEEPAAKRARTRGKRRKVVTASKIVHLLFPDPNFDSHTPPRATHKDGNMHDRGVDTR